MTRQRLTRAASSARQVSAVLQTRTARHRGTAGPFGSGPNRNLGEGARMRKRLLILCAVVPVVVAAMIAVVAASAAPPGATPPSPPTGSRASGRLG